MRGRRPTPTKLKVLLGEPNLGRVNYREAVPATNIADAPAWFTDAQRATWIVVVASAPRGLLKQLDRGLLESWVLVDDICRRAALDLARQRSLYTKKARTCLAIIKQFTTIKRTLAAELGFSPLARPRIAVTPEPDAQSSEFEKLLG